MMAASEVTSNMGRNLSQLGRGRREKRKIRRRSHENSPQRSRDLEEITSFRNSLFSQHIKQRRKESDNSARDSEDSSFCLQSQQKKRNKNRPRHRGSLYKKKTHQRKRDAVFKNFLRVLKFRHRQNAVRSRMETIENHINLLKQ